MLTYFAEELAEAVKESKRADVLWDMRLDADRAWESIHSERDLLEKKVGQEIAEIQQARAELDRKEKEVIVNMLEADSGNTSSHCRPLEKSLKQTIQDGELLLL